MTSRSHTPLDIQKIQSGWRKRQVSDDDDIQDYVRPWVGLTDQEIEDAIDDGFAFGLNDGNVSNEYVIRYVRVIEAKLKEKNT